MSETIYVGALFITLWATGVGLGMATPPRAVVAALRPPGRLLRLVVLNAVVVPLVVGALVAAFDVPAGLAGGLILVGAASAGPLGLKLGRLARADDAFAIVLVLVLELLNVVTIPFWLAVIQPAGGPAPLGEVVRTLVIGILLPLGLGAALGSSLPWLRARAVPVLDVLSTGALAVLVLVVLARDGGALGETFHHGVVGVSLATIAFGLLAGRFAAGDESAGRVAALVTAVRASGPALAAASAIDGPSSPAAIAIVAFALCGMLVATPLAVAMGRRPGLTLDPVRRLGTPAP